MGVDFPCNLDDHFILFQIFQSMYKVLLAMQFKNTWKKIHLLCWYKQYVT